MTELKKIKGSISWLLVLMLIISGLPQPYFAENESLEAKNEAFQKLLVDVEKILETAVYEAGESRGVWVTTTSSALALSETLGSVSSVDRTSSAAITLAQGALEEALSVFKASGTYINADLDALESAIYQVTTHSAIIATTSPASIELADGVQMDNEIIVLLRAYFLKAVAVDLESHPLQVDVDELEALLNAQFELFKEALPGPSDPDPTDPDPTDPDPTDPDPTDPDPTDPDPTDPDPSDPDPTDPDPTDPDPSDPDPTDPDPTDPDPTDPDPSDPDPTDPDPTDPDPSDPERPSPPVNGGGSTGPTPTPSPAIPSPLPPAPPALVRKDGTVNEKQMIESIKEAAKNKEPLYLNIKESQRVVLKETVLEQAIRSAVDFVVLDDQVIYRLPSSLFKGSKEVEILIQQPSLDEVSRMDQSAKRMEAEFVVEPRAFTIKVDGLILKDFGNYVKRDFILPADADPYAIYVGVVLDETGLRTLPTQIEKVGHAQVARVSSMSNSTYSVISRSVSVAAVEGMWSEQMVNNMATRGVITQIDDFNPHAQLTRGEFALYLTRALGLELKPFEVRFEDVSTQNARNQAIMALVDKGIVQGSSDGKFYPHSKITRQEMAAMMVRAMTYVPIEEKRLGTHFTDFHHTSPWAQTYMLKAVRTGLFKGYGDRTLKPLQTITHEEGLQVIYRLLNEGGLVD